VETFSERTLTYEGDIVNAFAGATEAMSSTFPGGIFHGLPMFYFDLALLWQPQEAIFRRNSDNNHAFPSWSWTGWKGAVSCLAAWSPFQAGLYRATDHYSDWISIVELCPVAQWHKISLIENSREILIRSNFYGFEAFRDKVEDGLPLGWSRHDHAKGVYFTNQDHNPGFRYSFPLPVPKYPEPDQHEGFRHILRCTAPRAGARLGEIKDDIWSRPLVELLSNTG